MDNNIPKWDETEPTWDETSNVEEEIPEINIDKKNAPKMGEAITRGLGQGLTFGLADEGAAGIQAGLDVATSDKQLKDIVNLYNTYKQLQTEREEEVQAAYPKTSIASEVVGSIPTALVPIGQAKNLATAGKLGAAYGFGKSKGSLTDIPGQVMQGEFGEAAKNVGQIGLDTAIGATTGELGYLAGNKIGNLVARKGAGEILGELSQKVTREAEDVSLSALGASKKALQKEHGKTWRADPDYRKGVGEEALDKVSMFGGPDQVRAKVIQEVDEIEKIKKPLIEQADIELKNKLLNPRADDLVSIEENALGNTLANLRKQLEDRNKLLPKSTESIEAQSRLIDDYASRIAGKDKDIKALDELKKLLNKEISDPNFAKIAGDAPDQAQLMLNIRDIIVKRIDELSDFAVPGTSKQIKELNRRESNLYDLGNIAFNKEISPAGKGTQTGDIVAATIGGGMGSLVPVPGASYAGILAGYGGKKILERMAGQSVGDIAQVGYAKGLQRFSSALDKTAKTITSPDIYTSAIRPLATPEKMSKHLYNASDEELSSAIETLNNDPKYSMYASALNDAIASKSSSQKNAVIFTIMQNPEMRRLIFPNNQE